MPDGSFVTFPEGMDDAAIESALTARRAQGVPGSSANTMSPGDWGRAAMTVGVRGATGLGEVLSDPAAALRALAYPKLAEMERQERTGASVPPLGEIAHRAGTAVFDATGVPEYQPTTPQGRIGMAGAQGAVGGGLLGVGGALARTGMELAPIAAGVGLNAPLGAASGAAGQTTLEGTGSERLGILASLVPGGAITLAGLKAAPRLMPERYGVNPTIGQALGGAFNRLEQGFGSIPFLGDFIKTGRAGAVQEFNRGGINRALGNIGEELDPKTAVGRDAIAEMNDKIGQRFDTLTPNLSVSMDPQFGTGMADIARKASMLSTDHQKQFGNTFRTEFLDRLSGNNMTGKDFRDAESSLGQIAINYRHSATASERDYGNLVADLQTELRSLLERSNPAHAEELSNLRQAYAEAARVQLAASKMGTGLGGAADYGTHTPAQMQAAVRQMDPTLRKRGFATGRALMQDYAEGGRRLLGDTLPDSGTPYRSLAALGAGALGTGAFNPVAASGVLAGGAGLGAMYSPAGRAAMNYFLRRPGQSALTGLLAEPDQ
jgi:hypothetical protein